MKTYIITIYKTINGVKSEREIGERSEEQVRRLLHRLIDLAGTDQYGGFDLMRCTINTDEKIRDGFMFSTYSKGSDYVGDSITIDITEKAW